MDSDKPPVTFNLYSARQAAEKTGAHVMHIRSMARQGRIGFKVDSFYVYTDTCLETLRNRPRYGAYGLRKDGRVKCDECGKLRLLAQTSTHDGVERQLCAECATTE